MSKKVVRKYKLGEEPDIIEDYLQLSVQQRLDVLTSIRNRWIGFKGEQTDGEGLSRIRRVVTKIQR